MSARIHYLPNARPEFDQPEDPTPRYGDGDGGGPEEIVVRIVLEMPEEPLEEQEEEPEQKSRGGWLWFWLGALLGLGLGS